LLLFDFEAELFEPEERAAPFPFEEGLTEEAETWDFEALSPRLADRS
jgi:hypothetical protein